MGEKEFGELEGMERGRQKPLTPEHDDEGPLRPVTHDKDDLAVRRVPDAPGRHDDMSSMPKTEQVRSSFEYGQKVTYHGVPHVVTMSFPERDSIMIAEQAAWMRDKQTTATEVRIDDTELELGAGRF